MSPADDRLWNEGRGYDALDSVQGEAVLVKKWQNLCDDSHWCMQYAIIPAHSFSWMTKLGGWLIRWRTDVSVWNWWIPMYVSWRDQVELIRNMKGWTHVMNTGILDCGSIIWDERSVATIQWVMSNPWMIPRVNDEYPQVSRHWHLWTETGYICWKAAELPPFPIRTCLVQLPDKFPCYLILLDQISVPKSTKPAQSPRAGCC